jgi:hypothetical protein
LQYLQQKLLFRRDLLLEDDLAGLVEDANGQQPGMEVDAAVKLMSVVIETHHGLLGYG